MHQPARHGIGESAHGSYFGQTRGLERIELPLDANVGLVLERARRYRDFRYRYARDHGEITRERIVERRGHDGYEHLEADELLKMSKGYDIVGKDLIGEVCVKEPYKWVDPTASEWEFAEKAKSNKDKFNVVCFDFGIKNNIMRRLASFGCDLTVVPANYSAEDVMKLNPDGILFSNGPGDPSAAPYAVENCKKLLGKVPVFGICMGHQVLGQAFGGKTFKMKFGHHGGNHPVRNEFTQAVEISAQNHNFAVDLNSLPKEVKVSHLNLNDGTCAGMVWEEKMAMTIQYHPEASPGPHDSDNCFAQFVDMIRANKGMAVSR